MTQQMEKNTDKRARQAGRTGESVMAGILGGLPADTYRVLNDLLLRTKYGTSQIDHIVVSPYMLFVIETKNYAGTVIGTDRDAVWTQVHRSAASDGGKREETRLFQNPVRQNFTHIQALMQLLKPVAGNIPMLSMVAFPEKCHLEVRSRSCVIRFDEVIGEIEKHTSPGISPEKEALIVKFLREANITDPVARRKHAASVRRKMRGLINHDKS